MSRISSVFLPTNEYLGILWALAGVKDVAVINHGTAGCNFFEFVTASQRTRGFIYDRFCSTSLEMEDIALSGGEDKLKAVIKEVAEKESISLIAIIANPVSALIGVDVEAIAKEMEPVVQQPILAFNNTTWKVDAENGVEEAIDRLIRFYCPKLAVKKLGIEEGSVRVNIIGPTVNTFNWAADEKELKRLLALIGLEINIVFPYETTTEALKSLPEADLNIVTSTAGVKAANYLEEFYDIPYIYGLPYGDKGTFQWLKQVAEMVQSELPAQLNELDSSFSYHHYCEMISGGEFYQRDWKTVLACPPGMAKGFIQMVKEDWNLPLEAVRLTSQPKLDELKEIKSLGVNKVYVTPGELEWKKALKEIQPFILLGSAEDTALAKEVPVQLRITAPAFDVFNIYDGNPLVGYVGYQSLTQNLFQEISRHAWTKK